MLVLDTHVWVWSVDGDTRRVGRRARQALTRAANAGGLRVSPVSVFEVVALCTAGRLRLAAPVERWIGDAVDAGGVRLAELTRSMAVDAGAIRRDALADPIDRLLVATARLLAATLITADERILSYAREIGSVRVQDARR